MLTKRQKDLFDFIRAYEAAHGIAPSYDEMKAELGLSSKSGVHRLVTGLEDRGYLYRIPHHARALTTFKANVPVASANAANDLLIAVKRRIRVGRDNGSHASKILKHVEDMLVSVNEPVPGVRPDYRRAL